MTTPGYPSRLRLFAMRARVAAVVLVVVLLLVLLFAPTGGAGVWT